MDTIVIKNKECKVLRFVYSSRGGGLEISLSSFGKDFKNEKMSVYRNYLGGGMLGKINSSNTIEAYNSFVDLDLVNELSSIAKELKKYFFDMIYDNRDKSGSIFEQVQKRSLRAF